jgi:hypothetical protein
MVSMLDNHLASLSQLHANDTSLVVADGRRCEDTPKWQALWSDDQQLAALENNILFIVAMSTSHELIGSILSF